jgi:hypothetical protein
MSETELPQLAKEIMQTDNSKPAWRLENPMKISYW